MSVIIINIEQSSIIISHYHFACMHAYININFEIHAPNRNPIWFIATAPGAPNLYSVPCEAV
jgi:hypothetical protein